MTFPSPPFLWLKVESISSAERAGSIPVAAGCAGRSLPLCHQAVGSCSKQDLHSLCRIGGKIFLAVWRAAHATGKSYERQILNGMH